MIFKRNKRKKLKKDIKRLKNKYKYKLKRPKDVLKRVLEKPEDRILIISCKRQICDTKRHYHKLINKKYKQLFKITPVSKYDFYRLYNKLNNIITILKNKNK